MNFTGEIQERLATWLSTALPLWQVCEGSLTVEEREDSGAACVEFVLPPDGLCIKWDIGTGISFKMLGEQKTADGAFMLKLSDGSWEAQMPSVEYLE